MATADEKVERYVAEIFHEMTEAVNRLAEQLASGAIDAYEWRLQMNTVLYEYHTRAWTIGRNFAGIPGGRTESDLIWGASRRDFEDQFLLGFVDKIERGGYTDEDGNLKLEPILRRAQLYTRKTRATVEISEIRNTLGPDRFFWVLGEAEHCADCLYMASVNPYTSRSLWTVPGDGDTLCLTNCKCRVIRESDGEPLLPPVDAFGTIVPLE